MLPIHMATMNGYLDCFKKLVALMPSFNVDCVDDSGRTLLHAAACGGSVLVNHSLCNIVLLSLIMHAILTPCAGSGVLCALDSIFDFGAMYVVCLFILYASIPTYSFFFTPPLLIFSSENRPASFPGQMS